MIQPKLQQIQLLKLINKMKKAGIFFALVSLLVSCDIPDDGKNIPTSKLEMLTSLGDIDTVKKETQEKIIPAKPILIARGSEPGWYAEFSANHLRLLINDGTDSLHLNYIPPHGKPDKAH